MINNKKIQYGIIVVSIVIAFSIIINILFSIKSPNIVFFSMKLEGNKATFILVFLSIVQATLLPFILLKKKFGYFGTICYFLFMLLKNIFNYISIIVFSDKYLAYKIEIAPSTFEKVNKTNFILFESYGFGFMLVFYVFLIMLLIASRDYFGYIISGKLDNELNFN